MVNDISKYIVFNGKKSSDFGVWASGLQIFETPAKRVERISVPGRNGDLIIEDGSFENVELTFKGCFIPNNFAENFSNFKSFLNRQKGYQRLELSWLPDEYRLATFADSISPTIKNWDGMGKFDITFNCKPQRFLKSGEEPITIIPPVVSSNSISTPRMNSTVQSFTELKVLSLPASESVTFSLVWLNEGASSESSYTLGTATEVGWQPETVPDLPADVEYWRINAQMSSGDSVDDLRFQLSGYFFIHGESQGASYVDGICGRSIDLINPTGFETRPVFEVDGAIFPVEAVRLYDEDNELSEAYFINSTDYSAITTTAVIDCENEYFYYEDDGKKNNITGHLTIRHVDGDGETLPVAFPKLGAYRTNLYIYTTYVGYSNLFVKVTPHWFTI